VAADVSWQAVRWAIYDAPVDDASELMVLIAICERTNEQGRDAYPSVAWIAGKARCSVRTAHRHIRKLRKEGLVRDGDQSLVSGFRADRRPGVYDVDMERKHSDDMSPASPRAAVQVDGEAPDQPTGEPSGVSPASPREHPRHDAHDMSPASRRDTHDMSSLSPRTPRGDRRGIHGVSPVADNKALLPTEVIPPFVAADAADHGDGLFDIPAPGPRPVLPTAKPERIPPDFIERMTPAMHAWAKTDTSLLNIAAETENFVDWWMSKGGPDGKKLDWVKTWKVWMRKEQKDAVRRSPRSRQGSITRSPDVPETY
jgi:hypothetical protein